MKLISCHIDHFGIFHDYDMQFDEHLNVLVHENGWGKSTLAAFLRAMLYGYDSSRKKSLTENDRKRYLPWKGGKYGGNLTFEREGKTYVITRSFGETARSDSMTLKELETGRCISDVGNVGEWLFKLDGDTFRRSVYITQNSLNAEGGGSGIHARLNALLGEAADVGAYDQAQKALLERSKDYEKRGGKGYISEAQRRIEALLQSQREAKGRIQHVESLRTSIRELDQNLLQLQKELDGRKADLAAEEGKQKERLAAIKLHQELLQQKQAIRQEQEGLRQTVGGKFPEARELKKLQQDRMELAHVSKAFETLYKEREQACTQIQAQHMALEHQISEVRKELEMLYREGEIPAEEELRRGEQGCAECNRLREMLQGLSLQRQQQEKEARRQYAELLEQQKTLENGITNLAEGMGNPMPVIEEVQRTRQKITEVRQLEKEAEELRSQRAAREKELQAQADKQESAGQIPEKPNKSRPYLLALGAALLLLIAGVLVLPYLIIGGLFFLIAGIAMMQLDRKEQAIYAQRQAEYERKQAKQAQIQAECDRLQRELTQQGVELQALEKKIQAGYEAVNRFFDRCGIPEECGIDGLEQLEQRIRNIEQEKQRLFAHHTRVAAFLEANRNLLEEGAVSAVESKLQLQLEKLKAEVEKICQRYGIQEEAFEGWSGHARERIAAQNEIKQRESILKKQLEDFQQANQEMLALTEKNLAEKDPALKNLRKKEKELLDGIQYFMKRYGISQEGLETWILKVEKQLTVIAEIQQKEAAVDEQIRTYEEEHREQLQASETGIASITALQKEVAFCENRRDALLKERTQAEEGIRYADELLTSYRGILQKLRVLSDEKQNAQRSLYVLKKSMEFLEKAKENLASRYMGQIEGRFNQYLRDWLKDEKLRGILGTDFQITMEEDGKAHQAEGYSSGYMDMMDFCMRMALIDTLFEEERPFLILDDPFVNLDEIHLEHALQLLKAMSADTQILYLVCHPMRASEPDSAPLTISRKRLLQPVPRKEPKAEVIRERYRLVPVQAVEPSSEKKRISNNIFTLKFTVDRGCRDNCEFELFFVDEKEKVICDKQRLTVAEGELVQDKLRFCLNSGKAVGKVYQLLIRDTEAPEAEVAKKISFEAALSFASEFDF